MSVEKEFIDIRERSFSFAVRVVKLCQFLEKNTEISRNLIRQLLNAGTSIGANLEEGQARQSKPDFISKNAIALKEARETNYWLRLILATNEFAEKIKVGVEDLRDESMEIAKVVGAIIVSAKKDS
ncbi:MAG: four helix bundle protein [Pyrinomonadaceae bacterium]|nr:four helix bundle protein [Pyrinomonadaceae bacterium]